MPCLCRHPVKHVLAPPIHRPPLALRRGHKHVRRTGLTTCVPGASGRTAVGTRHPPCSPPGTRPSPPAKSPLLPAELASLDAASPSSNSKTASTNVELSSSNLEIPASNCNPPSPNTHLPSPNFKSPFSNFKTPSLNFETPHPPFQHEKVGLDPRHARQELSQARFPTIALPLTHRAWSSHVRSLPSPIPERPGIVGRELQRPDFRGAWSLWTDGVGRRHHRHRLWPLPRMP